MTFLQYFSKRVRYIFEFVDRAMHKKETGFVAQSPLVVSFKITQSSPRYA